MTLKNRPNALKLSNMEERKVSKQRTIKQFKETFTCTNTLPWMDTTATTPLFFLLKRAIWKTVNWKIIKILQAQLLQSS